MSKHENLVRWSDRVETSGTSILQKCWVWLGPRTSILRIRGLNESVGEDSNMVQRRINGPLAPANDLTMLLLRHIFHLQVCAQHPQKPFQWSIYLQWAMDYCKCHLTRPVRYSLKSADLVAFQTDTALFCSQSATKLAAHDKLERFYIRNYTHRQMKTHYHYDSSKIRFYWNGNPDAPCRAGIKCLKKDGYCFFFNTAICCILINNKPVLVAQS